MSATSAKSGVSFDSKGHLQNGTLQDYFNGQLRRPGGGAFITTDYVWPETSVGKLPDACDNVADLISHSGATVLYTDVVDNQDLLNRLVNYEAADGGPPDGGRPQESDLDELVEIARRAKGHSEDPIASKTNGAKDSPDLKRRATAYVRMLRIAARRGAIDVRVLSDETIKAKAAPGAGRSISGAYIILASGEKENAKVGGAGLPVFRPAMNSGVISEISHNEVEFDPTVPATAWNGISFDANGRMENGTVSGLFNAQLQENPGIFVDDSILNGDSHGPVTAEKIASMWGALGTVIKKSGVTTVYTDLAPKSFLSNLVSRKQEPTTENIVFLADTLKYDSKDEAIISKLQSYVNMLRSFAKSHIQVKNINEIGDENAAGGGKYIVIGDYAKNSEDRSVAKLPTFHLNVHGDVARSSLENHFLFDPTSGSRHVIKISSD